MVDGRHLKGIQIQGNRTSVKWCNMAVLSNKRKSGGSWHKGQNTATWKSNIEEVCSSPTVDSEGDEDETFAKQKLNLDESQTKVHHRG